MAVKIKFLGHTSFLFNINKKNVLTDPYFHNKKIGQYKRLVPCSTSLKDLPPIDVILISHEHFDNFDIDSTNYLIKKFNSKVIAHQSILNHITGKPFNKIPIDEYDSRTIYDMNIKAIPAHHPTSFYPLSFIIDNNKQNLFFGGHTLLTNDHDSLKSDILILPIGGHNTMDMGIATRVAKKVKPKVFIPMQYNTFENIKQNPEILKDKLLNDRYSINTAILEPGKHFNYK